MLTIQERLFDESAVTPAVRANDTTDIHLVAGGTYTQAPSRPFRTPTLEQIQSGLADPSGGELRRGSDLGLYSITPNNDIAFDFATLEAYKEFRLEAERKGFRHFLEVFDPNACGAAAAGGHRPLHQRRDRPHARRRAAGGPADLPQDRRTTGRRRWRSWSPTTRTSSPASSAAPAGTTYDAFNLLEDATRHGARAALFGRKINNSEHQLTFVRYLRAIADGQIDAAEACRAYHDDLAKLGITPHRALAEDLQLTGTSAAYAGSRSAARAAGSRGRGSSRAAGA